MQNYPARKELEFDKLTYLMNMRFSTMWYVRSKHLLVARVFYEYLATDRTPIRVYKRKKRLYRLI